MIKKLSKKVLTSLLTIAMTIGMISLVPVVAEGTLSLTFDSSINYAIVNSKTQKAIKVNKTGWGDNDTTADGVYISEGNKIEKGSLFHIETTEDQSSLSDKEVRVKILSVGLGDTYPLRSENKDLVFTDGDKRTDYCTYIITKTGENKGTIREETNRRYLTVSDDNNLISSVDETTAVEFMFVNNISIYETSLYIEHKATGNYITLDNQELGGVIKVASKKEITDSEKFEPAYGVTVEGRDNVTGQVLNVVGLKSISNPSNCIVTATWEEGPVPTITVLEKPTGGWEAVVVVPNGDGTVSLRGAQNYQLISVNENNELVYSTLEEPTDNEKFIIHTDIAPSQVNGLQAIDESSTSIPLSWNSINDSIITGYEIWRCDTENGTYSKIGTVATNNYVDKTVNPSSNYYYKVRAVNGLGNADDSSVLNGEFSDIISVTTLAGEKPFAPTGVKIEDLTGSVRLSWEESNSVADGKNISYEVYAAPSAYASYTKLDDIEIKDLTATIAYTTGSNGTKYQYYKVVAKDNDTQVISDLNTDVFVSLEKELFGNNVIVFGPEDDTDKINQILHDIFEIQNDYTNDAQFNENRYAVYFKPGDYTDTANIQVGFYTQISGLGKTPYDVKLNNMEVPAYLDGKHSASGYDWDDGEWRNATCNFWRSAENLSIMQTEDNTSPSDPMWRSGAFNWAVAQAAPLRRIYSQREVAYDWNWGWASGGYVADCLFEKAAGTDSGQQFYTRNSEIDSVHGTTLNGFYQGVKASNLPTNDEEAEELGWTSLNNSNGYTNWETPVEVKKDDKLVKNDAGEQVYAQQVETSITSTPVIREKPFLFLDDDGEYKIFVPSLDYNTQGTTWSEKSMGEGKVVSLDEFYIAKEGDTAKEINAQLKDGKNIFFTPGIYYAEEVINVEKAETIILGTGMASIIPTNSDAAMKVADVDGVTIAGLIFDAGAGSQYLLQVGDSNASADHSKNPTLLADLFFRVGGTTQELTKADIALEINSSDVIGDHFWIWRADHGTGVAWDGNVSTNGLIVNGDNVTCYALFNEHFQEYNTLWNGENGSTYFYQNETCYDPFDQQSWMSHNNTVDGYSSYKVANDVEKHYAVGLGIYNVLIYAGGESGQLGDSTNVSVALENAIEVPNSEKVLIENACIQTFAKADGMPQYTRHIINGVGQGVEQGKDENGNQLEGWSRKFLISYNNGTAIVGNTISEQIGNETKYGYVKNDNVTTTIKNINALGDDNLDVDGLNKLIEQATGLNKDDYTVESWNVLVDALTAAKNIDDHYLKYAFANTDHTLYVSDENGQSVQETLVAFNTIQKDLDKAIDNLVNIKELKDLYNGHIDKDASKYTDESWTAFDNAMKAAKAILDKEDAKQLEVDMAKATLNAAIKGLVEKTETPVTPDKPNEGDNTAPVSPNKPDGEQNVTPVNPNQSNTDDHVSSTVPSDNVQPSTDKDVSKVNTGDATMIAPYAILGVCALGAYVALKKRKHG